MQTVITYRMDRRHALKWMGFSLAAAAMAGIAPLTHSAIIKDRQRGKRRLVFYFTATGNSLFVARQFSDTPLSIPQELKKKDLAYEADEIAFVCSDYAGAIPDWSSLFLEQSQGRRFRRAGLLQCFFLCVDRELWIRFQENYKILGIKSKKNVKFTENYSNPLILVIEVALISSTMSI